MITVADHDRKHAENVAEFRQRLARAMDALEEAARAVHDARMLSPTGEDLHLLRGVGAAVMEQVPLLHMIATNDEWTTA